MIIFLKVYVESEKFLDSAKLVWLKYIIYCK